MRTKALIGEGRNDTFEPQTYNHYIPKLMVSAVKNKGSIANPIP